MSKYTKGKWRVIFSSVKKGVRNKDGFICFLPEVFRYIEQDERYKEEVAESEANANLIASAPELLEALKEIASSDNGEAGCYYTNKTNISLAKQAIKKAEGDV